MTTGHLLTISLLLFSSGTVVVCQKCEKLNSELFPRCSTVIDQTVRLPRHINQSMFVGGEIMAEQFSGCSKVSDFVLCSAYGLPTCVEGKTSPLLPCRRVCDKFVIDCRAELEKQKLQWFPVLCSLLPSENEDSNKCIEPPDFHFISQGSPKLKCYKLTVPFCMGLGYDHTSSTPAQQRDNDTIHNLMQFIGNDTDCSPFLRRFVCIDSYFLPCFQQDVQGYYSLCQSDCENMSYICHDKISKFPNWRATRCPNFGTREGPKGLCKVTSWPQEFLWQLIPPGGEPSKRKAHLSTGKLVAAILTPVVVLIALLIGVGLWLRYRQPPGYYLRDDKQSQCSREVVPKSDRWKPTQ